VAVQRTIAAGMRDSSNCSNFTEILAARWPSARVFGPSIVPSKRTTSFAAVAEIKAVVEMPDAAWE
jgi:hypothetical protein